MGEHEGAARAAMDRVFGGQTVRSDGLLTVKNLAVVAAVLRSTMHPTKPIREFERRLQRTEDTAQPSRGGLAAKVTRLEANVAATERRAAGYGVEFRTGTTPHSRTRQPNRAARRGAVQAEMINSQRTERLSPWTPTAGNSGQR